MDFVSKIDVLRYVREHSSAKSVNGPNDHDIKQSIFYIYSACNWYNTCT